MHPSTLVKIRPRIKHWTCLDLYNLFHPASTGLIRDGSLLQSYRLFSAASNVAQAESTPRPPKREVVFSDATTSQPNMRSSGRHSPRLKDQDDDTPSHSHKQRIKRSGSSCTDPLLVDNSIKTRQSPRGMDKEKDDSKSRKPKERVHVPGKNFPTNFRVVPDSERIEALDKQSVQVLFAKRTGAHSLFNEAFSIKVARMSFRPPPPPDIPLFVQKAQAEYDLAMAKYNQQLEQLASQAQVHNTSNPTTTTTTTLTPIPTPPPPLLQYKLRPLRQYPPTIFSPHPPFRVTYVVSKKSVSKFATHRNFARKKLSVAVEDVFRQHARPGYEYMIFAKPESITFTQEKLKALMIKDLGNPKLYGERGSARSHRNGTDGTSDEKQNSDHGPDEKQVSAKLSLIQEPLIKVRWKNNQPPLHKKWWKYALPNPLGRANHSNAYLNMYCPEAQEALAPIREMKGRLWKMKHTKLYRENMKKKSTINISKQPTVK
ncbi:hypothetical protein BG011_006085 [Mortierella polycephala]|uniref:Uncharacterized protein n=1 Tax=Mortierella polycephala TaxID=41804 RepID=A0A9P6U026_9FUNG|nr:hypothetical protein BG011_006085 [Mortierella polycephala]